MDIEKLASHVRNIADYEGITEGQGNVLLAAATALVSEHTARLAAEAENVALRAVIEKAGEAICAMKVLEAGQSYGVRLAWGEIEKVQAVYDKLDAFADDAEHAAELMASSDFAPLVAAIYAGLAQRLERAYEKREVAAVPGHPETTDTEAER